MCEAHEDKAAHLRCRQRVKENAKEEGQVMPDAMVRTMPVPLVSGLEKLPDAEVVTRIIHVRSMPAAQLVPLLRPLIPQSGHLAAVGCTNDLILVDRFGNVKRIEAIIKALETPETYKAEKCNQAEGRTGGPQSPGG